MPPIDFPSSPTFGQTYSYGNRAWKWNGIGWESFSSFSPTILKARFTTIPYASVVNLDMALYDMNYCTITLAGNIQFTTSNLEEGRMLTLRLIADNSLRNLVFPGWKFIGIQPTAILANKTAILSVVSYGVTNADCVAAYGSQL